MWDSLIWQASHVQNNFYLFSCLDRHEKKTSIWVGWIMIMCIVAFSDMCNVRRPSINRCTVTVDGIKYLYFLINEFGLCNINNTVQCTMYSVDCTVYTQGSFSLSFRPLAYKFSYMDVSHSIFILKFQFQCSKIISSHISR